MSSNKSARQELERVFGKVCMIEELGIRNIPKEKRRKLAGYTKYDDVLTYHHIKEKHIGGSATFENGALVRGYNHRWLHTLEPSQIEKINQAMQDYKSAIMSGVITLDEEGHPLNHTGVVMLNFDPKEFLALPVNDVDRKQKKKFNRAQVKRDFRKQVEAGLYEYEYGDSYEATYKKVRPQQNIADTHEDGPEEVLTQDTNVYMYQQSKSSDMMKLILRSALKTRAQEILSDTTMPDDIRQEEFAMIEEYMKYITDFEENQKKLAEYDKMQKYIVDDGR